MGDRDSIYGFAALGLDTFPVTDPVEASKKLRQLAEGEYAVVYITEALAAQIPAEIHRRAIDTCLPEDVTQEPVSSVASLQGESPHCVSML